MKNRDLALLFFLAFATTTQGQNYDNGNYGTNKSVTVYSAKYTEHSLEFDKLIQLQDFKPKSVIGKFIEHRFRTV